MTTYKKKTIKIIFSIFAIISLIGFILPFDMIMPVKGATGKDYNHDTFWYYPWGTSGVHKGVDIFAKKGTDVVAATSGIVLAAKKIKKGGNIVLILGPKWRIHYYAHLDKLKTKAFHFVKKGEVVASVGDTGNAKGKSPHLHFSIVTALPYFWRLDFKSPQGYKKMIYLKPIKYFENNK